ncbi:hypothetical protein Poli38472_002076 [Pythium oligandrum]|uniref:Raptor N-terminal CASPase-like domain-containing protein n=1 Tax=Pythium oligandrum TaxID=41045 RepID=A0A8K1FGT7_PYTOL|nr:hypothetical protein Poli38472_002076 [Pythium oligandrum]|eukprot:TMW63135.1 hypothetical protein Poli38472_002076 [Pythium oligandrum]
MQSAAASMASPYAPPGASGGLHTPLRTSTSGLPGGNAPSGLPGASLGPGFRPSSSSMGAPSFGALSANMTNQSTPLPSRDFLHENYGGLRFARDAAADDDEDTAPDVPEIVPWRMRERMKTMDVALVLCLNIGTDPPDVVKASPCARKECWVDPFSMPAPKALETIGKTLQSQYERWQPRARYRQSLDPTVDEVKQLSVSLRRHAKHDRVLFHYNGHGVPRPTQNGEVWVFNKSYTQYIPLLVYDLQSWLGTPSIYVFDCSAAGVLLSHFNAPPTPGLEDPANPSPSTAGEAIVLAACGAGEILPMNPDLCADVFTSCLTTPITVALRWFISQNSMSMSHLDANFIDRIPGKLTDRKTPLGELNWIFTAITDTIAWNILPRDLFQKLFRQDLLVASLFRNFLLAERIMKSEGCAPCSLPALPPTNHHPLWRSWDLAAEICLNQLYKISHPHPHAEVSIQPSRFFAEQLTAFEVWLQFGASTKPPPQQLPMVLQVLLSQVHRLRALVLLKKFLDLGPWAVNLALSVGIFPYVLKLLQSPASELRQVLVFIWAKILALDSSCQIDLVKDDGHSYFITHLAASMPSSQGSGYGNGPNSHQQAASSMMPPDQKVMAAFILSVICHNCPQGQRSCVQQYLHKICGHLLSDLHDDVRKWMCLCLAKLWENFEDAKRIAIDERLPRLLSARLEDERPEVRAAAAYALGTLVGFQFDGSLYSTSTDPAYVEEFLRQRAHSDIVLSAELLWGCQDASPLVRRESVLAMANVVLHTYHQPRFESVAKHFKNRGMSKRSSLYSPAGASTSTGLPAMSEPTPIVPNEGRPSSFHVSREAHSMEGDERRFPVGVDVQVDSELVDEIGEDAKYYVHIWYILKEMQTRDPFQKVVEAVKSIVSRVNAHILATEQEALRQSASSNDNASAHSAGATQPGSPKTSHTSQSTGSTPALLREGSVPNIPAHAPVGSRRSAPSGEGIVPGNDHQGRDRGEMTNGGTSAPMAPGRSSGLRSAQSVGNFRAQYQEDYRGGAAPGAQYLGQGSVGPGQAVSHLPGMPRQQSARGDPGLMRSYGGMMGESVPTLPNHPPAIPSHGRQSDFPATLCSQFYEKLKARFNLSSLEPASDDDDPLSDKGAEKLERFRRYERIRKAALKIAPGFSLVNPAQPVPGSGKPNIGYGDMAPFNPSYSSPSPSSFTSSSQSAVPRVGIHSDRDEVKSFAMNLRQRAVLNNDAEMTSLLLFHPYETMLIVADEKDQISLYNFEQSEKKVLTFGNKNPSGSRLTSLSWINETEESLLTCGSDDGVIRIYQGLHTPQPVPSSPKLITSFMAVPDLVPGTRGSGLVTTWQQHAGMLYAGGNSSVLRGWNLRQERNTFSVSTHTDSCITTLATDETTGGTIVAGFGDGTLRLFDVRSRPEYALKCTMKEHTSWVVQTHLYPGKNELLSGSVSGELKFWDLRYPKTSVRALEAHRSPMTALAVHDYAPIFASGSHNQFIKVFRSDGEQLALIRYHEGFLGERIGPVSCLAFHPHRLYLAAGATDSVIAIYSSDK